MGTRRRVRAQVSFSLAADVAEALDAHAARTDIPKSRTVDAAVRAFLGLERPPIPADDSPNGAA
jgi:predicted transcriptional regulator